MHKDYSYTEVVLALTAQSMTCVCIATTCSYMYNSIHHVYQTTGTITHDHQEANKLVPGKAIEIDTSKTINDIH